MNINPGFIAVIFTSLAWGSYLVPLRRFDRCGPMYYQWLTSVGVAVSTVLLMVWMGDVHFSWWGVLSGLCWTGGSVFSFYAVRKEGLAAGSARWVVIAVLTAALWGKVFLGDTYSTPLMAIGGLLLLLTAIIGLSTVRSTTSQSSKGSWSPFSPLTGMFFGAYLIPMSISRLTPLEFLPGMAAGIVLGGLFIRFVLRPRIYKPVFSWGLFAGILWNVGNVGSFFAITYLGYGIGFAMTQLALFVGVSWGAFYFKEVTGRTPLLRLFFSAAILFSGAALLAMSR
ncbi:MAG: GRP family sugar transporter [Chitinivibrionales bacterium]